MTVKMRTKGEFTGQKLLTLAIIIFIIPVIFSCSAGWDDPLAYRRAPFSAEIRGRISPRVGATVEFSAVLKFLPISEGDLERGFTLTFTAPESLSGLEVCRGADGRVTLSMGSGQPAVLPPEVVKNYIKIAGMLAPAEDVEGISSIPGMRVGLSRYERLTLIELRSLVIAVDPATSQPIRAESRDGEIFFEVVNFQT